jgi:8-oxo-dGTP pyrophosphatase MutT (NUDIX family)
MSAASGPRSAATVILLRAAEGGGLEVFLTRRPDRMDVLGGAYVFPGGTLTGDDLSERSLKRCVGLSRQQAQQLLGAHLKPGLALGYWVAAIRELFEEVGVLLAATESGEPLAMRDRRRKDALIQMRAELIEGRLAFHEILESEELYCDVKRLAYFSHWQTPAEFSARFDTRFFVAAFPPDQVPLETSEEVAHGLWVAPERAMQLYAQHKLPMIFPTYACLRTLADFDSIESLLVEYAEATL